LQACDISELAFFAKVFCLSGISSDIGVGMAVRYIVFAFGELIQKTDR